MNWHQPRMNEAITAYEDRIQAANRIIHDNVNVIVQCHAALRAAREAIEWYNAGAFEVGEVPVSDWIADALDAGIRS